MKIAFYKRINLLSDIVNWYTRSYISHLGILFDDNTLIEAIPFKGVIQRPFGEARDKTAELFVLKQPISDKKVQDWCIKQLGKKYDWYAILGFVLKTTKEKRKMSNKWICSEIVYEACKKENVELLKRCDSWKLTPYDIYKSTELV